MNALVIVPWIIVLLVYCGPPLARCVAAACRRLRAQGWAAAALAALALAAATLYGGSKGGSTNEPPVIPPAVSGRIRLYHEDASGRLVPLDAKMKGVEP